MYVRLKKKVTVTLTDILELIALMTTYINTDLYSYLC